MSIATRLARIIWYQVLLAMRRSEGRKQMRRAVRTTTSPIMKFFGNRARKQELFALRYGRRIIGFALNIMFLSFMISFCLASITYALDHGWLTFDPSEIKVKRP